MEALEIRCQTARSISCPRKRTTLVPSESWATWATTRSIRAIVLRVDSPGGDALASDTIWRALHNARQKGKPVIVSMSDVAGSGGYYIAAGASRIVAEPATLTGSIGVVMVRPNIRGFLARLGINTVTISRGKFADVGDITTPLSEEGRQKLIGEMDHIYQNFVDRVATGRKLSAERVNEIGRGRVWTGAQARQNGLVDELGGIDRAIDLVKAKAKIGASEKITLVAYPPRRNLFQMLLGRETDLTSLESRLVDTRIETKVRELMGNLPLRALSQGGILSLRPYSITIH
jgi:protease-4